MGTRSVSFPGERRNRGNLVGQRSDTKTLQGGEAVRAKALGQETWMLSGNGKSCLWGHGEDPLNPSKESELSPQG